MKDNTNLLKQHNLKITGARIAVLDYLETTNAPVDSAEILGYLAKKGFHIDRATIFRTLSAFKETGLIKAIQLNEIKYRYELTSKPEHHHIVCTVCGNISDIDVCVDAAMEQKIRETTGYTINTHMLEFTGICPQCKRK